MASENGPTPKLRQLRVSVSIIVMVIGLQVLPQVFLKRNHLRFFSPFGFFVISIPLVMFALSAFSRWARRRRMSPLTTLVMTIALAAGIGAAIGLSGFLLAHALGHPSRLGRITSAFQAISVGSFIGLLHSGIWALAFVYPFAVEEARLRAMEAEKHRLEADKIRLETEALKLEADRLRAAAELARLRAQLEPHFLLNTLNAIAGLVTQSPDEARRLLVCLGDLLRDALEEADELQTLDDEIAWLRRYAEILESRHSGALTFRWDVTDEARDVLLPRLLLQPLVENAVKHGALQREGGLGEVVVRASLSQAVAGTRQLTCVVEDNGPGFADGAPRSGAFGLRAVRRRLELKWPGASLRLESTTQGTQSIVDLPLCTDLAGVAGVAG
jgi:sensor histidine kinase YesM